MAVIGDDLRRAIAAAVKDGEAKTSAELVVVVRPRSGTYRDVHYAVGFAFAVVTLVAFLYLPTEFPLWSFAIELVVVFALGALLSANVSALARSLVTTRRLDAQVDESARAAFFDKGVARTTARTGVLVYVSVFEQRARVLPDLGLLVDDMGETWKTAVDAANEAARDPEMLPAAIRALGVALAEHHPRAVDDRNELGDDVDVAG